jgi:carbon monoxide dehydrogenase subunit G
MTTPLREGRDGPTMPEGKGHQMRGAGCTLVNVPPRALWRIVTDHERLAAAIPGAETLRREDRDGRRVYLADVAIGVGFLKGTFVVTAEFAEEVPEEAVTLYGGAKGVLGNSWGEGWVNFVAEPDHRTRVEYSYAILITGAVAAVGGTLLDKAGNKLIDKFFHRLGKAVREERRARRAAAER